MSCDLRCEQLITTAQRRRNRDACRCCKGGIGGVATYTGRCGLPAPGFQQPQLNVAHHLRPYLLAPPAAECHRPSALVSPSTERPQVSHAWGSCDDDDVRTSPCGCHLECQAGQRSVRTPSNVCMARTIHCVPLECVLCYTAVRLPSAAALLQPVRASTASGELESRRGQSGAVRHPASRCNT